MKKIILSILGIGAFLSAYSQTQQGAFGFELGLRGAPASNWLLNSNTSSGGTQNQSPAFSYNYGLSVTFDFSDHVALESNVLLGTITQGYNGKFGSNEYVPYDDQVTGQIAGESYKSKTTVNVLGIPLLLRLGSGNGAYVEVGGEYQMIQKATYSETYTAGPPTAQNWSNVDVTPAFASSNIQGVLGFGDDFQIGSTGLNIVTDLRFYYGFTDLQGVDGHGQDMNTTLKTNGGPGFVVPGYQTGAGNVNGLYTINYGGTGAPYYTSQKPTHSAGVSFSIGLYYYLPITVSKGGRTACKHPPRVRS
jgi:hypothetical protein